MSHNAICPCPNCVASGRNPLGLILAAAIVVCVAVAGVTVTVWLGSVGRLLVYVAGLGVGGLVTWGVASFAWEAFTAGRPVRESTRPSPANVVSAGVETGPGTDPEPIPHDGRPALTLIRGGKAA